MRARHVVPALLAGTILCFSPGRIVVADGERGTRAEREDYQQREAQSKDVEQFEGGDAIVTVAVIAAIVLLVYFIIDHDHHH